MGIKFSTRPATVGSISVRPLPLPKTYVQRLRRWADEHDVLLIFDEVQTGFGRSGKWFAHEHYVSETTGLGLVRAIHVRDPVTSEPSRELARDWTWAAVKHGVMLFQVNRPTLKICPPLVIPDDALVEGIRALGDTLESIST